MSVLGGGLWCPQHLCSLKLHTGSPHSPTPACPGPSFAHLFDRLPFSNLICHPEERQRIIYWERRKTLEVSASDRHDTFYKE